MEREAFINKHLIEHFDVVKEKYKNVWFAALYGSQNYGLDDEESDVDTRALVIPTFDLLFKNGGCTSTVIDNNNEKIDVKDARSMAQILFKQNISFLEILFTDYVIVDDQYVEEYLALRELRERIARYNPAAAIKSMLGTAENKCKDMCVCHPRNEELIQEFGYDGKQLSNILRITNVCANYIKGLSFGRCIINHGYFSEDLLMKAKKQELSLDSAKNYALIGITYLRLISEEYLKTKEAYDVDQTIRDEVNEILYELYKKVIRKEFECLQTIES